jgi:hypothetical protein
MPQLGVDETLFRPRPQPALAEALSIPSDAFVVGYCGRFGAEKGLLTLCDALARPSTPALGVAAGRSG